MASNTVKFANFDVLSPNEMKQIIFLILITSHSSLISQSQFQRTIGGTGFDYAYSIIQTTDGGYAMAGFTQSFGAGYSDMYVMKLNGNGVLEWNRTVGGTGYDIAYSIIQTIDGGYAVAGLTQSFGVGYDNMYVAKLNGNGVLEWNRTVGGTGYDVAYSIIQTTDGGYAVAGYTNSFGGYYDMYIVKLDGSGTLEWSKTVGGILGEGGRSIIQTMDGGYAVAGGTGSFGGNAFYIVKLNSSGTLQWSRTIGGSYISQAHSIIQTTDSGYAVAGDVYSPVDDIYIVKLNSSGTLQWSRTIGGSNSDYGYSIIQTTDGGYAVAGNTISFGVSQGDMYIVKLDATGTLQWSKTVGGISSDYAYSIIQTTDSGYAVAGSTSSFGAGYSDVYIAKLDASGNTCGSFTSPPSQSGAGGSLGTPTSTVTTPSPTVITPSTNVSSGGIVTTICVVGIQPISNEIPDSYKLFQNYPNPFNSSSKFKVLITSNVKRQTSDVKVKVYDITGKAVFVALDEKLAPGEYEITFDANDLPSGVYFYSLFVDESLVDTKKMVLIK